MKKCSGILLAACLLVAAPALAGDLTFDNNQTVWRSSKCVRPTPPESVLNANPETKGNAMNRLIVQYNVYADAAQSYMNCIASEAEHDETVIGQAIVSGAQAEFASVIAEAEKASAPLRSAKE
jgi:hypothetical protein